MCIQSWENNRGCIKLVMHEILGESGRIYTYGHYKGDIEPTGFMSSGSTTKAISLLRRLK